MSRRAPEVRVREVEIPGGTLRVAVVRRADGGEGLVIERSPDGAPFGLHDPGDGERVALPGSAVDDLRKMLDELED